MKIHAGAVWRQKASFEMSGEVYAPSSHATKEESAMHIVEKAAEMLDQISVFANVSFVEFLTSVFMKVIGFIVSLLLGV